MDLLDISMNRLNMFDAIQMELTLIGTAGIVLARDPTTNTDI